MRRIFFLSLSLTWRVWFFVSVCAPRARAQRRAWCACLDRSDCVVWCARPLIVCVASLLPSPCTTGTPARRRMLSDGRISARGAPKFLLDERTFPSLERFVYSRRPLIGEAQAGKRFGGRRDGQQRACCSDVGGAAGDRRGVQGRVDMDACARLRLDAPQPCHRVDEEGADGRLARKPDRLHDGWFAVCIQARPRRLSGGVRSSKATGLGHCWRTHR